MSAGPWTGGGWGPAARCVLAPNPGPMTLDGTNTWLLAAPGSGLGVVVDPGPLHEAHLAAVVDAADQIGVRVAVILLTHGHSDHAGGAARFAELTGAPVRAVDPALRMADGGLADGDVVAVGGLELRVVAAPGHTSDSLCFLLTGEQVPGSLLLTGDTVLGRGTTMIAHPGGRLGDYLASLQRLARLSADVPVDAVLPGHGPVLADPVGVIEGYLAHRRERLDQVAAVLAAGATSAEEVVRVVYADVDPVLWPAAELSVRAQMDYLQRGHDPS